MNQLITAAEAVKLAEYSNSATRDYIIKKLDNLIRKAALNGTRMQIDLYCSTLLTASQSFVVRTILESAGYTVMSLVHMQSPDPRDQGLSWFAIDIAAKPTRSNRNTCN